MLSKIKRSIHDKTEATLSHANLTVSLEYSFGYENWSKKGYHYLTKHAVNETMALNYIQQYNERTTQT